MLRELNISVPFSVSLRGSVAYAAQTPFIFNDSIRQNILFGRALADRPAYDAVLQACALTADLADMAKGDHTEIGEEGQTLSGGQKQRISLARAAFADADVVLLDDCLSAVDASVGAHIWQHCIKGVMADKTRLMVTHALQYLHECDTVCCPCPSP